jgi:hypothetical protein
MKKDFTAIYCFVDDFIKSLANNFSAINTRRTETEPISGNRNHTNRNGIENREPAEPAEPEPAEPAKG